MISYYELLGLIKEGKQPDKVKYNSVIYKFDGEDYHNEQECELLKNKFFMYSDINLIYEKSIEIIEDKPKKIEEMIINKDCLCKNIKGYEELVRLLDSNFKDIANRYNETIKAVNYLLEVDKHE